MFINSKDMTSSATLDAKAVTKAIDEHIAMTLIDIYYKYCLYCSFTPPLANIRKLVLWVRGCLDQYPAFICSIRVYSSTRSIKIE